MNAQPHVHQLGIGNERTYWVIQYGDQREYPDYPWVFRWNWYRRLKLRRHVRRIIRKHDRGSRRQDVGQVTTRVLSEFALKDGRWGSEQVG